MPTAATAPATASARPSQRRPDAKTTAGTRPAATSPKATANAIDGCSTLVHSQARSAPISAAATERSRMRTHCLSGSRRRQHGADVVSLPQPRHGHTALGQAQAGRLFRAGLRSPAGKRGSVDPDEGDVTAGGAKGEQTV